MSIDRNAYPKAAQRSVQDMGRIHDIGLERIVEGAETAERVRLLKENNCFLTQGCFFDRPLPRQEFELRLPAARPAP